PHRPDVTAGSGRGAGRLEIADHGGDERPRSHSRLEKTLRDEALVGSGDRHPGNAELLGETAGRREAVARAEAPAQDGVDDAAVDPADPVARRGGGSVGGGDRAWPARRRGEGGGTEGGPAAERRRA